MNTLASLISAGIVHSPKELFVALHKFDYAFATLTFAILGLSIQFSPAMGKQLPILLVVSWVLLLVSGVIGGWRIANHALHLSTLLTSAIPNATPNERDASRKELEKATTRQGNLFLLQSSSFLVGLALNGIFVSVNYLASTYAQI